METTNLSDADFKTLVIRMLKELTEYSNSFKKTQAEMEVTLSEIKRNLQGTNCGGDEAKIQISDLEHKEEKKHSARIARRKKNKKERKQGALAGVAQWIEHQTVKQRVASSIPSQDTCLGFGPGPQWGACERQPHFGVSLPLFLLLSPLSKNK